MIDIVRRKIAVYDGQLVDPFTVTHLDGVFRLETIAHALCLDNRYGGHTSDKAGNPLAYSTAEHCLNVERVVDECTRSWRKDMPSAQRLRLEYRREALIHDAPEAYLRDVLAPIKHDDTMAPYREVEERLTVEMRLWFGFWPVTESQFVKAIDVEIRGTEARQLFRVIPPEWEAKLAPVIPGIQCGTMTPIEAKSAWLAKFHELWPDFKE